MKYVVISCIMLVFCSISSVYTSDCVVSKNNDIKAFWVNLESSHDRKMFMEEHLNKHNIANKRINAVTLDNIYLSPKMDARINPTLGEVKFELRKIVDEQQDEIRTDITLFYGA